MQKVIDEQVKHDGSLDFSVEKEDYTQTPKKDE